MKLIVCGFLGLIFSHAQAIAEGAPIYSEDEWGAYLEPNIGSTLRPRAQLQAWESYPSGLFFSKGDNTATIDESSDYEVIDKKVVPSVIFGDKYYLQIRPVDRNQENPCMVKSCWVYQGKEDSQLPENLLPSKWFSSSTVSTQ